MNIMKDKINIILTFQDYFDAVSFDTAELKEKVAYVLFYVTGNSGFEKGYGSKDYSSQDK